MLSDAQIERFSRQIVLPQVGGAGQTRLLASSVAVGGAGAAARTAARYLTGAGVGRVALHGAALHDLASELADVDPAAAVAAAAGPLAGADADVLVAAGAAAAALDEAAASGRPLVAGASRGQLGWLVAAPQGIPCASCAARQLVPAGGADAGPLAPIAAGVIGALLALEALALLLDLPVARPGGTGLQFDAGLSSLQAVPIARLAACPRCAAG